MKKRMLSILLTLCMMLMLCPVTAFAETAPPDIVFDGNSGTVNGSNVSLSADFTLQGAQTLTIENGKTLTIPSGKTLTVEANGVIVVAEGGSLVVGDGGSLNNSGTIYVEGTFTGTADNLYYPLSYTFYPPLDRYLNTAGIDGTKTYNGKTYGKAGSSLSFYGFPAIGSNQLFKLVTTTSDGSNSVATNGSTPSVMMPFAQTTLSLELKTDCIFAPFCEGGTLNDENLLKVDGEDGYCLDNSSAPLPTDIVRDGYEFAGWYYKHFDYGIIDENDFEKVFVENLTMGKKDYYAEWKVNEAPKFTGLENGKTYCDAVEFEVTDNVGVASVTAGGVELSPSNGKYTLAKGVGTVTVVATDNADNETSVTVTVNDGHTGGTATCVAKAVCEYCGEEYGELDSTNHNLEKISATDATVTETGNKEYWHCLDCDKYFADENGIDEIALADTVISKLPPEIIEGKGQSITAGEKKELTFKSNAAFSDFVRVELDGKILDEKNYTVKEGSTVVTLKADYVAALSAGEHSIGIVSESGTAATTFTVQAKAAVPKTGDNSHMALWIALILVSGAGVIGTTVYGKKKCSVKNI